MVITFPYSYGYRLANHTVTAYEIRIKRHRTKYFYPYQDCKRQVLLLGAISANNTILQVHGDQW